MYFIIKAVARSLLLPPAGNLIIAILGALLLRARPRLGALLLVLGLGSMWALATPIVADAVSRWAERCPALDLSAPIDAQAIVVLGGGGERSFAPEFQGPEADIDLLARLSYGAHVARATHLPVLVSGTPRETDSMKVSLERDFGVPTRWVEDRSRDTYENARFSAQMLFPENIRRIVLITSSTHLYRAAQEYRSAGFEVLPAPAEVLAERETGPFRYIPGPWALMRSNRAIYELLGEPMRRLQALAGIRERFDTEAARDPTKTQP